MEAIALGVLGVLVTAIFSFLGLRHKSAQDYLQGLERRVTLAESRAERAEMHNENCEEEKEALRQQINQQQREIWRLWRQLEDRQKP